MSRCAVATHPLPPGPLLFRMRVHPPLGFSTIFTRYPFLWSVSICRSPDESRCEWTGTLSRFVRACPVVVDEPLEDDFGFVVLEDVPVLTLPPGFQFLFFQYPRAIALRKAGMPPGIPDGSTFRVGAYSRCPICKNELPHSLFMA